MLNIFIQRLHIIPVRKGKISISSKATVLAELMNLGFRVKNPDGYSDSILPQYTKIINHLRKMKGGNVAYVPLFSGFPDKAPEENKYFAKRIIGFVANVLARAGLPISGSVIEGDIAGGVIVPDWLFDLKEFGADPITQFQDEKLFQAGVAEQKTRKGDACTQWVDLEFVEIEEAEARAKNYLLGALYAKSSIKEALKPDLETLLNHFGAKSVDPRQVGFKEIRTFLMKYHWDRDEFLAVSQYVSTATDVLRLCAVLTDSDVSLAAPIRFPKFSRPQRRFILHALDQCGDLEEDFAAYKGLWLALGRSLHPGEFASKYPYSTVYAAFDSLRNGTLTTFNGRVEAAILSKDLDTLIALLSQRPGVFARRLHHVLEIAGRKNKQILAAFEAIAEQIQLKNLLILHRYFSTIEDSDVRTIINKRGRVCVLPNKQGRTSAAAIKALLKILSSAIKNVISRKDSWSSLKLWIDPELRNYTIPLQQRKASDGLLTVGRGTQVALGEGNVLRLFVWWKQVARRTDLDLSLITFDQNMNYTGHVSYTKLSSTGIQHSGDIQSAPYGATEFIDVTLDILRKKDKKTRYIAAQIYRYSGETFLELSCHAGWMMRDKIDKSIKSFDIKTVQHKFDVNGVGAYAIPIIIDLLTNRAIFVDVFVSGAIMHNRVEGAHQNISAISKGIIRMLDTKPNLFDLANFHCNARGGKLIENKDQADITFGLNNCDYNAGDFEKILSELL